MVLTADSSADIRNTQTVEAVMKGDRMHHRSKPWSTPPLAEPVQASARLLSWLPGVE